MSANPEINRANAQHSTGPKTEEGKQRSSLNALRHGLTGQIVVMPGEDMAAYHLHLHSFTTEYQPKGHTEATLVQLLAETTWRLHRVAALETNLLTLGITHSTNYTADAPEQIQDALAIAAALEKHSRALSDLSLHSQRLSRQFERTLLQLRDLQKQRREQKACDLNQALDMLETAENNGGSYDPSNDGFLFSKPELDYALRLRNRARRAQKASSQLLQQTA
jgi:hypothetical protein